MIMPPCGRWKTKRLIPLVRIAVVWYHYGKDDDMKRVLVLFLAVVFWVSCVVPFGANAVVVENTDSDEVVLSSDEIVILPYWYTVPGIEKVGRWTKSQIKVYISTYSSWSSLSRSNMESYFRTAFSDWKLPGKTYLIVSSSGLADIQIYGITSQVAQEKGYTSDYAGVTDWNAYLSEEVVYENSGGSTEFKGIYNMTYPVVYLFENATIGNQSGSYHKVMSHELGHALGYYGHYLGGTVMKPDITKVTSATPSPNEKKHLSQLY